MLKQAGKIIFILILCLPLAVMGTLVTSGFWNWFESATGIESMGHSGPATWCYVVVYALCIAVGLVLNLSKKDEK